VIASIWRRHQRWAIAAVGSLAAIVIVSAALLVSATPGRALQAGVSPSGSPSNPAVVTASVEPSPSPAQLASVASPSPSPTGLPPGWAYSDLDGVPVPTEVAHRLPLAFMIDDFRDARPQSGFSSASIVYQAMVDDSSDRYMMVFQEGTASDIGPVRSTRPYFVRWAAEYKPLFGHFGGDAAALQVVIPEMAGDIYNEDGTYLGACPYHRIDTRVAPYNAYTNTAAAIGCLAARDYPTTYQGLPTRVFVDDKPPALRPQSQSITIPYPAETVSYKYDPSTDSYLRLVDGALQIDPANKKQVVARNIVVMFQAYAIEPSLDHLRPVVSNVGSGQAIVFKEGRAITGTWKKTSNAALTTLYDSAGKVIPLVRGEIFMQSVPVGTAVSYK
jgi:hypothetical protein